MNATELQPFRVLGFVVFMLSAEVAFGWEFGTWLFRLGFSHGP
jgi:hypothetical protein